MTIRFKSCESVIGAKVEGVSLRQLPDEATIEVVEEGLEHYGVLIFRDQDITPEEQIAWSRALGPLALTHLNRSIKIDATSFSPSEHPIGIKPSSPTYACPTIFQGRGKVLDPDMEAV